ncbi:PREDICTED: uncharacterized protein LOC105972980 [Erythranthe guttata]|uniref:uncharacterized protein LOC105972980 n=1 Tax=Erythranthe guttata TaxID=4155 RepID=UPI00064DC1D4|nr:PREDICTED: uncharacterized protein LOC105972980 [Erythranthe guttata]|eukprot:XP_012853424.1 PREDICTED: uncharacterized protein LOC105972980 [Erythranthe guttata]
MALSLISRRSSYRNWISNTAQKKASAYGVEPWLMIKDGCGEEDGVDMFYSVAENQGLRVRGEDGAVVGSSHGWVALCKWQRVREGCFRMFLHNPLFRHCVNLPRVKTLPNPKIISSKHELYKPRKVILSNDQAGWNKSCRAIMSYGPQDRLAYCCPDFSKKWIHIGVNYKYDDFVYSSKREKLFCVTKFGMLESWDLEDRFSPKMNWNWKMTRMTDDEEEKKYLVFAELSNRLFLVRHNAIGFDVDEIIETEGELRRMDGTLDGMTFFIGSTGHGFVVEGMDHHQMKKMNLLPDSIYFTDTKELVNPDNKCKLPYGCIFNYKNKTFSPCYYLPYDIQTPPPPQQPVWFTPCLVMPRHH